MGVEKLMTKDIEIRLLAVEEYKSHKSIIPPVAENWWLRTIDDDSLKIHVSAFNDIRAIPSGVLCEAYVRPAILITLPSHALQRGNQIRIGSKQFTVIDVIGTELYCLCDECISVFYDYMHPRNQKWSTSDLKTWLETKGLKLIF